MAGVIGDDIGRVGAYQNMQRLLDFAARERTIVHMSAGGLYRLDGPLVTRSNLWLESEPGAVLRPTEWSAYASGDGQFLGNVFTDGDPNLQVQSGIRFDIEIDGSLIPRATFGIPVSATSNTITLPAAFDGKIRPGVSQLTVFGPTGISRQDRRILTWNAGTRTATINGVWDNIPGPTYLVGEGGNDNAVGFARGAYDIIGRVRAYDFPATWLLGGSGGKAVNMERGCRNFDITVQGERCGWAAFVQGTPGTFPDYSPENQAKGNNREWSRDIRLSVYAKDCECALGIYGITSDMDPSGYGDDSFLYARVQSRNCGHATSRPLSSNRDVKSGVIVLAEASNFSIDLDSVTDFDFNPVWPTASGVSAWFAGAGLSGGIGAVIQGWGNNGSIRARHTDSGVKAPPEPGVSTAFKCDALYNVDRARAMGDDAGPTGVPKNVFNLDMEIAHIGVQPANGLVWQRGIGSSNIDPAGLSMNLKFIIDYAATTIIGTNFAYNNADISVLARPAGNQRARGLYGSAARIKSEMNNLASADGFYNLRGSGSLVLSVLTATAVYDVGTVNGGVEKSFIVTVPGVNPSTKVFVQATYNGARITGVNIEASVTAADTVTVYFFNATGSAKTPAARTWSVTVTTMA
ncbi:hypothetical protein ASE37_21845 [Rhizobium sp. Root268]|nr:hypothetical protein ASC86_23275 [Rhizobium sp. Root1212]KRD35166.1 hypothetical protein ASE37_21845 [Rhizobium sp. Root268]